MASSETIKNENPLLKLLTQKIDKNIEKQNIQKASSNNEDVKQASDSSLSKSYEIDDTKSDGNLNEEKPSNNTIEVNTKQ